MARMATQPDTTDAIAARLLRSRGRLDRRSGRPGDELGHRRRGHARVLRAHAGAGSCAGCRARETLLPNFYQIGVLSLPVVALTGTFIGMVLAVQSYSQFRLMNLETRLGAVINMSLVRELGPVLAATMLAGRVGSAMAAELGTMRVTEQIDALTSMGANPIHYLVVPRFLACLVLIPTLTIMADFMGVVGGYFYSIYILGIDSHHYWQNSQQLRRRVRPVHRRVQEPVLRRGDRRDQLLSRLSLRPGRRRRGPGRDQRVRDFVRDDPDARFLPGHRARQRLPDHLARRARACCNEQARRIACSPSRHHRSPTARPVRPAAGRAARRRRRVRPAARCCATST